MKQKSPPWIRFGVGDPATDPNRFEPDCCPLKQVYHIAHTKEVIRVIEDGRIRSGLVYDESRLKTKRTCVSWVSPNRWSDGSLYGNVQFIFDWKTLTDGKRFYWVEHRETQKQTIIRLLICDGEFTDEKLVPFDPTAGDGPLYHDVHGQQWYFNGFLTNEYMILDDLPLDRCAGISFCHHHPTICKKKAEPCHEKGQSDADAAAIVLARLIGSGAKEWAGKFGWVGNAGHLDHSASMGLNHLSRNLGGAFSKGSKRIVSDAKALSIVASMCLAYSYDQPQRVKNLSNLFTSSEAVKKAFRRSAQRYFKKLKVDWWDDVR